VTTISSFRSEAIARGTRMLRTALGPLIAAHLEDPSVVEIMLNPDGRLWIDRLNGGLEDTGHRIALADAERSVRLVAHHVGAEVHAGMPRVSAELPETGERFEGLVPPVVAAPCFAIRRPASRCSRSTTTSRPASCRGQKPIFCAARFASAGMSSSLVAPRPARRRWSTRSSQKSQRPATGLC
jgi:Flp pilus assembly CpaF family ATPase